MDIPVVQKAVSEVFPVGLIYTEPDLDESETIESATVTVLPATGLTIGAVTVSTTINPSDTISAFVSGGAVGIEYTILFKVLTSGGKTFNNPNRDAVKVSVI